MNIDVLKDLSPAEPASAGGFASVRPVCRRSLSLSGVPVVSRGLLPRTGGIRRRARPPAYRHHAAPAWQERRGFDPAARLPVGAQSRSADRHRLLFGFVGFEVQPARAAYHRFARICGLFPETTIKRGARPPEYLRTADEVEIIGHRGGLLSVGREGALTGNRVDCFILDDLYISCKCGTWKPHFDCIPI